MQSSPKLPKTKKLKVLPNIHSMMHASIWRTPPKNHNSPLRDLSELLALRLVDL
jgi:hypothetical protein